jgi:hypothetical protein
MPRRTRKSIVGIWAQSDLDGQAHQLPLPLDLDRVKSTVRRQSLHRRESVRWEEDDEEDPLHLQLEYLRCIIEQYPNDDGPVLSTMESILERFKKNQRYHGDARYFKVWVAYCNLVRDPDCVYEYLHRTGMFTSLPQFYEAWSICLEKENVQDAIEVVKIGLERGARPVEKLQQRLVDLHLIKSPSPSPVVSQAPSPVKFTVYEDATSRKPKHDAPLWQPGSKDGTLFGSDVIMCSLTQMYPNYSNFEDVATAKVHEVTFEELHWATWQHQSESAESVSERGEHTPPQMVGSVIGDFETPTKTRDGKSLTLPLFPSSSQRHPLKAIQVWNAPKDKNVLPAIAESAEHSIKSPLDKSPLIKSPLPAAVFSNDETELIDPWNIMHAQASLELLLKTRESFIHRPLEDLGAKKTLKRPDGIVMPFPNEWIQIDSLLSRGGMATLYLAIKKEEKTLDDVMKLLELELSRLSEPTGVFDEGGKLVLKVSDTESVIAVHEFFMATIVRRRLWAIGMSQLLTSIVDVQKVWLYRDEGWLSMPFYPSGSLLSLINRGPLDELVAVFYAVEVLTTMEGVWEVGIVHGDVKPDNFLLRFGSSDWANQYDLDGSGGWSDRGVILCDFGRAMDLQRFSPNVFFKIEASEKEAWDASVHCWEMRHGDRFEPFWQDWYGVACVFHTLLFGKYMVVQNSRPELKVKEPFKRYWNVELWTRTFHALLNPRPDTMEVLKDIRVEWQDWLVKNSCRGKSLKSLLRRLEIGLMEAH